MRYLLLLLFSTSLYAQTPIIGEFRIPTEVDTRMLVTSLTDLDMQSPKCEVFGEAGQCLFNNIGMTFDQGFPPTLPEVLRNVWELTVEPLQPAYDGGDYTLVIDQDMNLIIPELLVDTGSAYGAVCNVFLRRIEQEVAPENKFRFILIEFTPCDGSAEIPLKAD